MLYPFGYRALWSAMGLGLNVLWCRHLHLTVIFTENLLLKRSEVFSQQAMRVDSLIFYPFSYRAT